LSYACGPSERPLLPLTLGGLADKSAEEYGDREALVSCHQGIRKTFWEVREEGDKLAAGLVSLGLTHGDRIGIWGPNSYEVYK